MKLTKVRITEFQSIQDSTEFEIGDVTCLVGKNEAGKTALLKALYRLNPINESDGNFDVTEDYPRQTVNDYEDDVESGRQEPAQVVQATYALENTDIDAIKQEFGPECLKDEKPILTLSKGYSNELTFNGLGVNDDAILKYLIKKADLSASLEGELLEIKNPKEMLEKLTNVGQTESSQKLVSYLKGIAENDASQTIINEILIGRIPKFLYFDEYYQLKGEDNLDAFKERVDNDSLENPDYPLIGLINLARINLDQLINPRRTQTLRSKLEGAGNTLTRDMLKHWSQNRHLRMQFDIRPGQSEDPPGMTSGTNIWGLVEDTKHYVTTSLGSRSRGFIWFFSFLAWYNYIQKENTNLILLLDEPGLSLHAKAQEDLLRYFETELKLHHQLIYSTHSPFMVDPTRLDRVRIVQDLSIERDLDDLPEEQQGTRVITEVLEATEDSLFPLQGALGYEIYQNLFIGPNNLVVEGPSDLLYIQAMSSILQKRGKAGLSKDWTLTPVGGSGNVTTFVALIGAQSKLNVAVLIDYQKRDRQSIENLYKTKLMEKKKIHTYADFVEADEADIEDLFGDEFYLQLVNGEFETNLTVNDLPIGSPRILKRLEEYFKQNPLPNNVNFNHYRPARYFSEKLESQLTDLQLERFQKVFDTLNDLL